MRSLVAGVVAAPWVLWALVRTLGLEPPYPLVALLAFTPYGLIQRLPRSNTYILTRDGIRVAVFYTKLQTRLLRPLMDADKPPAPINVRRALATLERTINDYVLSARLTPAA